MNQANWWEAAPLETAPPPPSAPAATTDAWWEAAPLEEAAPVEPSPQDSPDAATRFGSFLGGVNTGIASVPGLPMETVKNVINLGIAGVGTAATAFGRPDLAPDVIEHIPGDVQSSQRLLRGTGVNLDNLAPEDRISRVLHSAGVGVGSTAAAPVGGAGMATARAIKTLAGSAGAGTGAGVATEAFPESTVAPLIGGLAPTAASQGAQASVRGAARGGAAGRKRMGEEIAAFKAAGTQSSLGQATGNRAIQGAETMLGSTPGASGVMARRGEQLSDDLGAKMGRTIDGIAPRVGEDVAGNAIRGGIAGKGGFVEKFKLTSTQLYNDVDRHLPPDLRVAPQATAAALERLTTPIQGAENVSGVLQNPKVLGIQKQLSADLEANNGVLPYQALKALRTKVGSMLSSSELIADIPRAELKQLYGSLSEDMRGAATQAGPAAIKAFERANQYTAAGHKRIEDSLQSITSKADPEDVYKAALAGTKEGATTLRAVKRSLKPEEFQVVAATALNRLGRATPGKQNDLGERFSSDYFLSNWNRLDPQAKRELLSGYSGAGKIEHSLNAIAKVASNVRDGSKVWANPPGTSGALIAKAGVGGLAYTAATGQFGAAGLILGGMTAANLSARAMTNPKLVGWFAEGTRLPASELPRHLTRLASIAAQIQDPEEKAEAEELLRATTEKLGGAQGK